MSFSASSIAFFRSSEENAATSSSVGIQKAELASPFDGLAQLPDGAGTSLVA